MGDRPEGTSIDRIDNNKGYFKENCRWATTKEQARNMRNNINITYKSKTQCLAAWSKELGINYSTLRYRVKTGWSIEKTFETLIK